jgi:hypothetical protein
MSPILNFAREAKLNIAHFAGVLFLCYQNITRMSNKKAASKKTIRKEARQKVYDKLAAALAEFKTGKNEKKFEKKLKKTSKLFAVDIVKSVYGTGVKPVKKKIEQPTEPHIHKTA